MAVNIRQARTDIEVIGNENIFYRHFTNAGEESLAVDGSITPVKYTLENLTDADKFILTRIDFLISVGDIVDINQFGNLTRLTNGLLFNVDGSRNLQTNGDLMLFLTDATIDSVKVEGLTQSIINGHWDVDKAFFNGLVCEKDKLYFEVRDNLSTISYIKATASGLKL